jgi:DHA3 family macrolide efflux protein-like MFS transporter
LTPLLVVRTFGEEVWKLTANELAFSAGMLLGGAAIAAFAARANRVLLVFGATGVVSVVTIVMGLPIGMWVFFSLMLGWSVLTLALPSGRRAIAAGWPPDAVAEDD